MLESKLSILMVLLQLWTLAVSTNDSNCVDNYVDFEEQTFGNNSENRVKLYQAFYPPNDHLPYSVVVSYQAVLPNGTKVNISSDPSCPDRQVWQWLSSSFLLNMDPIELNRLSLYTLNHFTEWVAPHLTIATPLPCSAKAEEFLTLMTTSLQAYALGKMSKGEHLGCFQQGCDIVGTAILSLKFRSPAVHFYKLISNIGFICTGIFISVVSVTLLQALLKALSQKLESCNYSFDYYGMFWGMSAILCPVIIFLLYKDIAHTAQITFNPDIQQTKYAKYVWPFVLAFPIVSGAPVAIYFGVKFNLPTPSVYLLPAKLLCCCNEKHARTLVLSLTLWFDLVAATFLVGHGVFVLKGFPVAPFAVAVNVLLLVLTFMCLTYIMALVFTISAFVRTRRCLKRNADCVAIVRAAMLIPLLLAVICFSFTLALNGQFNDSATQQISSLMIVKSLFTPVILAVLSLGTKWFTSVWMNWSLGSVDGCPVSPLHGHGFNRYQVLTNAIVDIVH